jgi:myo-inositol catabolism protein IolS
MPDASRTVDGSALPRLGLGCWSFAGGEYWGDQPVDLSIRTVHAALDAGVTLFDTAANYDDDQHSEEVLGLALEGRRDRAFIATKVARPNMARTDLIASCDASLTRLRTDRIDLLQLHWPNWDVPVEETAGAIGDLIDAGKVGAFGVCNHGPIDLAAMVAVRRPVSNQMAYNLMWRGVEDDVVPLMQHEGIGMICYSPLAQGLLTGRYAKPEDLSGGQLSSRIYMSGRDGDHGDTGFEDEAFGALRGFLDIAAEVDVEPPSLAVAWLLSRPTVRTVLVGARAPEEIEAIAASVDIADDRAVGVMDRLSDLTAPLKDRLGGNLDMWKSEGRIR